MTAIDVRDIERFWAQVGPVSRSGCRLWGGKVNSKGYGQFHLLAGGSIIASRFACILQYGLPPEKGMHAAHGCRNRTCVAHVTWKTPVENEADKHRDGTAVRGSAHHNAKLTEDDVVELRRIYAAGEATQRQLASKYGITQVSVSHIVRGLTWKHVPNNHSL